MKIERITSYVLRAPLEKPFRFSQWSYAARATTLVCVETTSGLQGWGEAYGPPEVTQVAIDSFFAPLLRGRDAWEREALWHLMYARSLDYGQKGVMLAAISALDIALWDLCAAKAGVPLYRFLGGAEQQSLSCYATGFYFGSEDINALTKDFAQEARKYCDLGFGAMKLKVGIGVKDDLRLIEAVRNAVPDETHVMIDANHAYNATTSIQLAREAARFRLTWFEEPVSPMDLDGYTAVRRASSVPIAGGECEYTRFGFDALLRSGGLDYVQPDLCACGGITEGLKIATLASLRGIHLTPHAWGTAVGQAAALHFYAALVTNPSTLVPDMKLLECDLSENPLRNAVVEDPILLSDGKWQIPQGPGLGITVCPESFAQFSARTEAFVEYTLP